MSSPSGFFCCSCFEELDRPNLELSMDELFRFNSCIKNDLSVPCTSCNKAFLSGHQLIEYEDKPESNDLKKVQT